MMRALELCNRFGAHPAREFTLRPLGRKDMTLEGERAISALDILPPRPAQEWQRIFAPRVPSDESVEWIVVERPGRERPQRGRIASQAALPGHKGGEFAHGPPVHVPR